MILEKQVTSLELSKRMKELGFPQESLFYWSNNGSEDWRIVKIYDFKVDKRSDVSAYTVAELGEMLYKNILAGDNVLYSIECVWEKNTPIIRYFNNDLLKRLASEIAETEADARAKMLIYLKENNLISRLK